jgi:hypothetical protein
MSESESNPGADRRAVIAGVAAAAGAASPLLAGAAQAQPPGALRKAPLTTIKVDLGGVHLPEAAAAELEATIRRAVLTTLAQAGVKGTQLPLGLNPGLRGIIYRPDFIPAALQ